ncbi:unnamed protein product [Leuciscus chuanchicus]
MRVPVRRWAGLWPWMLMAGLEVVLGHTGLELAAAVETERALIKVTLLKQESTSRPIITLEGVFAGGSAGSARGKLMQECTVSLLSSGFWEVVGCVSVGSRTRPGLIGGLFSEAALPDVEALKASRARAIQIKPEGMRSLEMHLESLPQVGKRRYPNLTGFSGPVGGSQAEKNKIRHDDGGNSPGVSLVENTPGNLSCVSPLEFQKRSLLKLKRFSSDSPSALDVVLKTLQAVAVHDGGPVRPGQSDYTLLCPTKSWLFPLCRCGMFDVLNEDERNGKEQRKGPWICHYEPD